MSFADQDPQLIQSQRDPTEFCLVNGAERNGNVLARSIPIEDQIARPSQRHKLCCEASVIGWGNHVSPKLLSVINCRCIWQEKDLGDFAQLRADIDQFPTAIAPNAMMLGFKIEVGNMPNDPAISDCSARSLYLARHIIKAG